MRTVVWFLLLYFTLNPFFCQPDASKSHIKRAWRTWSWVSSKWKNIKRNVESWLCYLEVFAVMALLAPLGLKRVDTLCWRNAAWCQSHVAPTGENHLGRNQNPEQIAWNENHLFHETGLVRNLWRLTDYNWSEFKTCVMIHRPFKLFKMVFEVIQSKSRWI